MATQRRSARQQSREPESIAAPAAAARARARGPRNRASEDQTLAAVAAFNNGVQLNTVPEEAVMQAANSSGPAQDPYVDEPIKATSPRTTFSEAILRTVIDKPHLKLGDLYSRSHTLLHKLVNKPQTAADIELLVHGASELPDRQNPTLVENMNNFRSTFDTYKQTKYIFPKVVIKASLPGFGGSLDDIPQGPWRPDAVLHKANLAALARDVVLVPHRTHAEALLDEIDTTFPEYFLEKYQWPKGQNVPLPAGTSKHVEQGHKFLLEARTQLAICRLQNQTDGFNYGVSTTDLVHRAFFEEGASVPKGAAVDFMPRVPMSLPQIRAMDGRMAEILDFSTPEGQPDVAALNDRFPFEDFKLLSAIPWIRSRNEEVEMQISSVGGVDIIADEWETYIAKNIATSSMQTAAASRVTQAPPSMTGAPAAPPQPSKARRIRRVNTNDDGTAKDKARGVVDTSVAVDPNLQNARDQADLQAQLSQGQKRVRPLQDVDGTEDASQDVGFEHDGRPISMSEQRRQHLAHMSLQQSEQVDPQLPGQTFDPEPALTPADRYKLVQEKSRSMTAISSRHKLPQRRKPWELDEVNALLEGIENAQGASYAAIKKRDMEGPNILKDRDAEGMRHKARNMKFDYLKAGTPLPVGFDHVLLDRKFQDKMAALGIPYVQQQARAPPKGAATRKKDEDAEQQQTQA